MNIKINLPVLKIVVNGTDSDAKVKFVDSKGNKFSLKFANFTDGLLYMEALLNANIKHQKNGTNARKTR